MNGSASKVCNLLASAHHARMEVLRIEREMRACVCQRELAVDICQTRSDPDPNELFSTGEPLFLDRAGCEYQFKPEDFTACWKATYVPEVRGDYGRIEQEAYWDHAGGNAEDGENHHLLWCGPCQTRETIRKGLAPARRRLAGLKSAIWAAAKKCAEFSGLTAIRDAMPEGE